MTRLATTQRLLNDLHKVSTSGFALALHVRFTAPTYLFQTYPKEWMEFYTNQGLVMHDPNVRWGFENDGIIRWSDLAAMDEAGVLKHAADHGLSFGLATAVSIDGSKSIGGFARPDREFTDEEVDELMDLFKKIHRETADDGDEEYSEALKKHSVELTHG